MKVLLTVLRLYSLLIIIWAIMTWIPGVSGSQFHYIIGLPVVPVVSLFSFVRIGNIGLQAVIVLAILWWVETMIEKKIKEQEGSAAKAYTPDDGPEG